MDVEQLRDYCLSLPGAFECFPFGDDSLVFKVGHDDGEGKNAKMFGLISLGDPWKIALKCDPDRAQVLRERHGEITPAYHFNKRHWNDVRTDGGLDVQRIGELISHSYGLAVDSLPRRVRDTLCGL